MFLQETEGSVGVQNTRVRKHEGTETRTKKKDSLVGRRGQEYRSGMGGKVWVKFTIEKVIEQKLIETRFHVRRRGLKNVLKKTGESNERSNGKDTHIKGWVSGQLDIRKILFFRWKV